MNNENLQNDGVPPSVNVPPMDGVPPNMNMDAGAVPPTNALSIYGQDAAVEDFPVLKAFQQYIDAEQSKSRKRMIMLSMFFGVLMTILVAVFVFLLVQMNHSKDAEHDKLVEFLMREREAALRAPAAVQPAAPAPANDAALKAVTDALAAMQKQIADDRAAAVQKERDAQHQKELEAAREETRKAEAAALPPEKTAAQLELDKLNREKAEKLKRANALLQAERRKLAAEKEKLRQEKIEEYRRKHYPELYAPVTPAAPSPSVRPSTPRKSVTIKTERPKPAAAPKKPDTPKPEESKKPDEDADGKSETPSESTLTSEDEPIEYFSSEDGEAGEYRNNELGFEIGL